jgi:glycosyltransferase involved in cell wall biosynthesis
MNVTIISGNAYGEDYGGVAEHVKYLLSHLSKFNEIRLNLVTFGNENKSYDKNGIKYVVLKRMKFGKIFFPLELIYDFFRIKKCVMEIDPDIVHIQSTVPLFSLFGIFMIKKYPIIITLHGYFNQEYKFHTGIRKIFYGIFCAPIERFALSRIPYVVVLCPQIENIIQKFTKSKISIIPNGIDLGYIQKINSYEKKDYPAIFFLGYLTKGKGVEDLIKAIQLVKIKFDNVKLYIGGIGPHMTKLQKLVQDLNLKENVTFLGLLDGKEKFAYMKAMDIFVLPSYWESFPVVLLEAMACGKPIITTDVGGNPYAVINGTNGFLVKPGDCYELSEKIIKLLNDKDLIKKMGEESLKRADDFDWSIIVKQTREVYEKIVFCYDKKII